MSETPAADVHAPYVQGLADAKDWAGLVRYWLAHQHEAALDAAMGLVPGHTRLAAFLTAVRENPIDFDRESPDELLATLASPEQMTLFLLLLYPRLALCEIADQYPIKQQHQLYRIGLESAERACQLAQALEDQAVHAFCCSVMARASYEVRNLEASRERCEEALGTYHELERQRPAVYRPDLAKTLHGLGAVQRAQGELEEAQASFQEALGTYRELERQRPGVYRPDLAITLINLGKVQGDLGESAAARASFQEALRILPELAQQRPDLYRPDLARTLHALGVSHLAMGDWVAAQGIFHEALRILRELARQRPDLYRPDLARTLNALGESHLAQGALAMAQVSFRKALRILRELARQRPDLYRPDLARTLNAVGAFQEALGTYRELAQQRPDLYRPDLAMTLINLGKSQRDLGELEAARDSFQQANTLLAADAERDRAAGLDARQRGWYNLAHLYLHESEALGWPDRHLAREALRKARDCAEAFRGRFRDRAQRRRVQENALHVYESLLNVNVDLWHLQNDRAALHEAVETAEESRARILFEMLAEDDLSPAGAPPHLAFELRQFRRLIHDARQRLHAQAALLTFPPPPPRRPLSFPSQRLEAQEETLADTVVATDTTPGERRRGPGGDYGAVDLPAAPTRASPKRAENLQQQLADIQQQYDEVLKTIRTQYDPDFDPERPVRPVTLAQARELLPSDLPTAFVLFCLTAQRGHAFVITREDVFDVPLPNLNAGQGSELAMHWYDSYYGGDRAAWEASVPEQLRRLSERAMHPVVAALDKLDIRRLILAPHKSLHVFPLHACTLADGKTCLADRFDEVGYVPSLSILHRCARRRRPAPAHVTLVENPTGDLDFTEVEGAGLHALYPHADVCRRAAATRPELLRAAETAHVFHYSGHATFDRNDPLRSALVLQDRKQSDGWLTLRHVFTEMHLRQTSLAVLNGCESGMVRPEQVDEYFGLSAGFLFAGAACVVSTMWSVWDLSSALLSLRFHEGWREGQTTPLAALSDAQRWLRGLTGGAVLDEALPWLFPMMKTDTQRQLCTEAARRYAQTHPDTFPFASPVHWAAFMAAGLSYWLAAAREEDNGVAAASV
jgi:CHAT domain-containing protein/tetratricopeptide (TPR) repeat protein